MARPLGAKTKHRSAGQARERAWQSMRILMRFTVAELVATAEIEESNARKYVRRLHRTGYLRLLAGNANGHPGSHSVWLLVRNSGPRAPIPRTKDTHVWDLNTKQLFPEEIHHGDN